MAAHPFADAVRAAVLAGNDRSDGWPIFYWQGPDETDDRWSALRRETYTLARRAALDPGCHTHRRSVAMMRRGIARAIRREILVEQAMVPSRPSSLC